MGEQTAIARACQSNGIRCVRINLHRTKTRTAGGGEDEDEDDDDDEDENDATYLATPARKGEKVEVA